MLQLSFLKKMKKKKRIDNSIYHCKQNKKILLTKLLHTKLLENSTYKITSFNSIGGNTVLSICGSFESFNV